MYFRLGRHQYLRIAINIDVFRTSEHIYVHFFYIIQETANAISFRLPLLKKLFESLCCNLVLSYSQFFLTHWHPYWVRFLFIYFWHGSVRLNWKWADNGNFYYTDYIYIYIYIFIMPSFWDSYTLMSHGELVSPKSSVWNSKSYCVKKWDPSEPLGPVLLLPMAAQLSKKAVPPLVRILATASCRSSKTGSCISNVIATCRKHFSQLAEILATCRKTLVMQGHIYQNIMRVKFGLTQEAGGLSRHSMMVEF